MRVVNTLRERGVEVRQSLTNPNQFYTVCPSHSDTRPSLSFGDGPTAIGVQCKAGCDQHEAFDAFVRVTGLDRKDFYYEQHRHAAAVATPRVTLATLATAKKLPVSWFEQFGITDGVTGIHIPYFSQTSQLVATRVRHALRAKEGSSWLRAPGADKAVVSGYGAWSLPAIRQGRLLILVEGETDVLTGWWHRLPVIGIPGKASARAAIRNTPGLFHDIDRVVVVEEPDDYANRMFQRGVRQAMTEQKFAGELFVMRLPAKDLSQLHIDTNGNHEAFMAAFNQSYAAALDLASWPTPGQVSHEILRVATWVTKTAKPTFGVKDCFNATKDVMTWAEVAQAFELLVRANWIRALPPERKRGRPSPKYRRNPGLPSR